MDDESCEQIWEFKKRDNNLNFSSVDSESSSDGELEPRKHKLVSHLVLPDNNEVGDTTVDYQNDNLEPVDAVLVESGKVRTKSVRSNKKRSEMKNNTKKTSSAKEGINKKRRRINKKRECSPRDRALMDDLKELSQSLLQDLRVESDNILAKFKEDLKQLRDILAKFKEDLKQLRDVNSIENDNHRLRTGQAQQQNSTASEPQLEQQRHVSLRNGILPAGLAANFTRFNCGRRSLPTNAINHHRLVFNFQPEVPYPSFTHMGTNPIYVYQSGIQTCSMGSGFPLSLHQGLNNSSNIPSQIVTDGSSGSNAIGWRINGGPTGSSASSHLLSGNVAANNSHRAIGAVYGMNDPRFGKLL